MPNFSALLRSAGQRALASGGLGAVGLGAGATAGGALGGLSGYRQAKEQGESGVAGAFGGALRGAGRGAAVGGVLGAASGALGGQKAQELTRTLSARKDIGGKLSRFGERQVHSLTGALPAGMSKGEGLRAIGGSQAATYAEQLASLKNSPISIGKGKSVLDANVKRHQHIGRLERAVEHATKGEELGATSVPGFLKALATHPKDTLTSAVGQQWHGTGRLGKALTFGLPTAMVGNELVRKSEPGEESRVSRAARSVAGSAPMLVAPALGITGSAALSSGMGTLLNRKKRGTEQVVPAEDPALAGTVERVYSPSITGQFEGSSS